MSDDKTGGPPPKKPERPGIPELVEALTAQISVQSEELNQLLARKEAQISSLQSYITAMEKENSNLQVALDGQTEQRKTLESLRQQLESRLEAEKTANKSLAVRIDNLTASKKEQEEGLKRAQTVADQVPALQQELQTASKQIASLQESHREEIQDLHAKFETRQAEFEFEIRHLMEGDKDSVVALMRANRELRRQLAAFKSGDNQPLVARLTFEVDELRKQLNNLENLQKRALLAQIDALQAEIDSHHSESDDLRDEVSELRSQIEAKTEEIKSLISDNTNLRSSNADLSTQLSDLTTQLESLNQEMEQLRQTIDQLDELVETLQAEITELRKKKSDVSLEVLSQRLNEMQEELDAKQEQLDQRDARIVLLEGEITDLKALSAQPAPTEPITSPEPTEPAEPPDSTPPEPSADSTLRSDYEALKAKYEEQGKELVRARKELGVRATFPPNLLDLLTGPNPVLEKYEQTSKENETLRAQVQTQADSLRELYRFNEEIRESVVNLTFEKSKLESDNDRLETETTRLREQVEQLTQQETRDETRISQLEARIEELKRQLDAAAQPAERTNRGIPIPQILRPVITGEPYTLAPDSHHDLGTAETDIAMPQVTDATLGLDGALSDEFNLSEAARNRQSAFPLPAPADIGTDPGHPTAQTSTLNDAQEHINTVTTYPAPGNSQPLQTAPMTPLPDGYFNWEDVASDLEAHKKAEEQNAEALQLGQQLKDPNRKTQVMKAVKDMERKKEVGKSLIVNIARILAAIVCLVVGSFVVMTIWPAELGQQISAILASVGIAGIIYSLAEALVKASQYSIFNWRQLVGIVCVCFLGFSSFYSRGEIREKRTLQLVEDKKDLKDDADTILRLIQKKVGEMKEHFGASNALEKLKNKTHTFQEDLNKIVLINDYEEYIALGAKIKSLSGEFGEIAPLGVALPSIQIAEVPFQKEYQQWSLLLSLAFAFFLILLISIGAGFANAMKQGSFRQAEERFLHEEDSLSANGTNGHLSPAGEEQTTPEALAEQEAEEDENLTEEERTRRYLAQFGDLDEEEGEES